MIRSLYIAASGMNAQKQNMDVISNNIANISTYGFKQGRAEFQDLMYQAIQTPGAPTREGLNTPTGQQVGLGVSAASFGKIFTAGDFTNTGNQLDLAIQGEGFFQILEPDGTMAYSRNGAFKLDMNGRIVNDEGLPLQPEMTVPADTTAITVGSDGTVSVAENNQINLTQIGQIELARFPNNAGLKALGKNLYMETDASGTVTLSNPEQNGFGSIAQGFLETSNVNIVNEMVNMIVSQRAYETNSKAVQSSDEMLQIANGLKR